MMNSSACYEVAGIFTAIQVGTPGHLQGDADDIDGAELWPQKGWRRPKGYDGDGDHLS